MHLAADLPPDPLGSLQSSPDSPAGFSGLLLLAMGWGMEGGMEGSGVFPFQILKAIHFDDTASRHVHCTLYIVLY